MKQTRCKMTVTSLEEFTREDGSVYQVQLELSAVQDNTTEENNAYWDATPAGSMSLSINNVDALPAGLEVGDDFYIDLHPIRNPRKG